MTVDVIERVPPAVSNLELLIDYCRVPRYCERVVGVDVGRGNPAWVHYAVVVVSTFVDNHLTGPVYHLGGVVEWLVRATSTAVYQQVRAHYHEEVVDVVRPRVQCCPQTIGITVDEVYVYARDEHVGSAVYVVDWV